MDMNLLARKIILTIAANKTVVNLVSKHGMKWGAARFVAGSTLAEAVQRVKELNSRGIDVTLDHLGESITSKEQAREAVEACLAILDAIHQEKLRANLSLKLTQIGLDIDYDFCLNNMREILERAQKYNNFVRIDMEDSDHCQITFDLFYTLLNEYGPERVGIVVQAYLYRTARDVEELIKRKSTIRLCKGAYKEPAEVAYPSKKDVDANYLKLAKTYLRSGVYFGAATHDEKIIRELMEFVEKEGLRKEQFEFQMLYGIRRDLQEELVKKGWRMRVYVPYGKDWYPYFSRRLAERPANLFFILKNMLKP
ncbi:L-proline dehydrogenase [Carboxydocella thermautotrophica]|nr:L-proline dehydrogenase [Carboxydocella thermautotrophica]